MPLMSPFAMEGAAPSTTTKRMAPSVALKRRMASGNHAIDGIVCSPVIMEPTPARRMRLRETTAPSSVPITVASANPWMPRQSVVPAASTRSPKLSAIVSNTSTGPGST